MHCCISAITLFLYIWSSIALGFCSTFHRSISSSFASVQESRSVFILIYNIEAESLGFSVTNFLLFASGSGCRQVADFLASFWSCEPPPPFPCAIANHFWDVWGDACSHISWYLTCMLGFFVVVVLYKIPSSVSPGTPSTVQSGE